MGRLGVCVLSTFIFEPVKWIDRFGWRRLSRNERLGCYCAGPAATGRGRAAQSKGGAAGLG